MSYSALWRPSRLAHRGVPVPAHSSGGAGLGEYVHLPFASERRLVCFAVSARKESLLGPAREASNDLGPLPPLPPCAQAQGLDRQGHSLRNSSTATACIRCLCGCGVSLLLRVLQRIPYFAGSRLMKLTITVVLTLALKSGGRDDSPPQPHTIYEHPLVPPQFSHL